MKKALIVMLVCLPLLCTMGFVAKSDPVLTSVETTVIKTERVLRYDLKIKNTSSQRITSKFDYPGYHHYGLEVTVIPNDELASFMEMDKNSRYKKMSFRGGGGSGLIEPSKEASFHAEYKIKENVDIEKVRSASLDGSMLILDGTKVIVEIPLSNSVNN